MSANVQGLTASPDNKFPAQETENVQRKGPSTKVDLVKHLQKKNAWIKKQDKRGYEARWKRWLINQCFYEGKQYGEFDRIDGTYIEAQSTPENPFYISNLFSPLIDSNMKEASRSKTKLIARPSEKSDSPEVSGAARKATWMLAHEQKRLRTPLEQQGEWLTASMCGVYARYTAWNLKSGKVKGKLPQFEKKQVKLADEVMQCLECGVSTDQQIEATQQELGLEQPMGGLTSGGLTAAMPPQMPVEQDMAMPPMGTDSLTSVPDAQGMQPMDEQVTPVCPNCGSPAVEMLPPVETEIDAVVGYQEMDAGQCDSWNVDPYELRVDVAGRMGRVRSCSYIYWEHDVPTWKLETTFPGVDVQKLKGGGNKDSNLRYVRQQERSAGGFSDPSGAYYDENGSEEDSENITVSEAWLDFEVYSKWELEAPVTIYTASGEQEEIPAGVPLGEIFPEGLYYCMVGAHLLTMRNEDKNDHWVIGVYAPLPSSFWGRGVEDSVREQMRINDLLNMWVDYVRYCSSPIYLLNTAYGTDANEFEATPGFINTMEADPQYPISNAITQMNPPAFPAHVAELLTKSEQRLQQGLGAFSTSSQMDIDITTATGIKLLRESNVALIAKALVIKAQVDAEWGAQVLKINQKNWIFPHPVDVEDEYGAIESEWFSTVDIDGQLEVVYDEGSVTPRSEIEKRNDLIEAATAFGVPGGLWSEMIPQDLRKAGVETFGVPFNWEKYRQNERLAKIRCDQLIEEASAAVQGAQQAQLPTEPDPMLGVSANDMFLAQQTQAILAMVPIEPLMDVHMAHKQFIQQWFHKDEGIYADEFVKEVMRQRWQEHDAAETMQLMQEQQKAMAAQAPMMAAQAEMAMAAGAEQGGPQGDKGSKGNKPPETPASKPPVNLEREMGNQPADFLR